MMKSPQPNQLPNQHPFALSQQQVWLDHLAHPGSSHVNVGGMGCINGILDLELFEQTMQHMVKQNQALRLQIVNAQALSTNTMTQHLVEKWPGKLLNFKDFSHYPTQEQADSAILQWWKPYFEQPIDLLSHQRPWQISLIKTAEKRYVITLKFHHLLMDGFAIALILEKLSTIYVCLKSGQPAPDNLQPDYIQFIHESNKYAQSKNFTKDGIFWQQQLADIDPIRLPKLNSKSDDQILAPAHHHQYLLDVDLQQRIALCAEQCNQQCTNSSGENSIKASAKQRNSVTPLHLYLAVLALYFCRTLKPHLEPNSQSQPQAPSDNNQPQQIVFGVPVRNRSGKKYGHALGMFIMVIPLPIMLYPNDTIADLASRIAQSLSSAYRHAKYPYNQIMNDQQRIKHTQDSLFDIVLAYETENFYVNFGDAPTSDAFQHFLDVARYPLIVGIAHFHQNEPVRITLETSDEYFSQHQTEQLGQRYHHLLKTICTDHRRPIAKLPLLPQPERQQLLIENHQQVINHTNPVPFITLFEQRANTKPKAVALRYVPNDNSEKIATIDYQTLNRQANQLAHKLIEQGATTGQLIALLARRTPNTMVAIIAIAKAGCAFVPLNPNDSSTRINQLIELSGAQIVLDDCTVESAIAIANNQLTVIALNKLQPPKQHSQSDENLNLEIAPTDLAYLLFTSGTSGTPKGVLMEHGAISRRLLWLARTFNSTQYDIALQTIQLNFDPAIIEILLPLCYGGSIALPPPELLSANEIAHYAQLYAASHIIFVPTILNQFNQIAPNYPQLKLRIAISGGETLTQDCAQTFTELTGAQLFNLYGPTEACVFATAARYINNVANSHSKNDRLSAKHAVPIGTPVDDTQIYILDNQLDLLPQGICGEIYIAGKGLARGYLLKSDNEQNPKFIDNPFISGQRMYRTGDKGYWNEDNELVFVERIDNQIKLRGHRIEPSHIEHHLAGLDYINVAAVKVLNLQLHAWLVLNPDHATVIDATLRQKIRQQLSHRLPSYMIPEHFHPLAKLPQQTSGKTDYKSLTINSKASDYALQNEHQPTDTLHQQCNKAPADNAQPLTQLESLIAELFIDSLNLTTHSINQPQSEHRHKPTLNRQSDFFVLGGDSLKALNLLNQLQQQIHLKLPLSTIMTHPTIAGFASYITQQHNPLKVDLSYNKHQQAQQSIYIAASGHGDALRFAPLGNALGQHYSLLMLQPPMPLGYKTPTSRIKNRQTDNYSIYQLACQYADLIEQAEHKTPPILTGFSIAGLVMLETARLLTARGVPIGQLILIDTAYPSFLVRHSLLWRLCGAIVKFLRLQELNINNRTLHSLFDDSGLNGQIAAMQKYRPTPTNTKATLIISSGFKRWYRLLYRPWQKLFTTPLEEQVISGFHGTLFAPDKIAPLVKLLKQKSNHRPTVSE